MRRRNTLIGLGTIVFGASGFIASGAFEFGSEGSRGDFVRVSPNEMTVGEEESVEEDGNGTGGGDDESNEESEESEEDDSDDEDEEDEDEEEDEETEYYTLRTSISGEGSGSISVSPLPVASTDGGERGYETGQTVTLSASPDSGSEFAGWSGDTSGEDSTVTMEMDENKSVTATFERSTFDLGVTIGGDGSGTVSINLEEGDGPSGSIDTDESWSGEYAAGSVVSLSISPDEGSTFNEWSGDASGSDEQIEVALDDRNKNVVALLGERPTLVVNTNGEGEVDVTIDGETRTVSPNSSQSVAVDQDTSVTLSATANEQAGYEFVGWSGDVSGDDSTIEVEEITENTNVTATFELQEVDLAVSVEGSGSVSVSPPGETIGSSETLTYEFDESVELTADPDENYEFLEWEGDLSGGGASETVSMDQDRSVTAVFAESEPAQEYDLAISIEGSGSVSLSSPDETVESSGEFTYEDEETVELTANPDENYRFLEWNGDLSGEDTTQTVRMGQDRSVTAVFVKSGAAQVQVVADPGNTGNAINVSGGVEWSGQMTRSEIIETNQDGFFAGFSIENANRNAVSRIGTVGSNGYPRSSDRIAFLVANVGDPDDRGQDSPPVDVGVRLVDADGNNVQTDQLRLPYRVLNKGGSTESGRNLVGETIRLSVGSIIEVVIEIDSTDGTEEIERVGSLQFSAQGVNN